MSTISNTYLNNENLDYIISNPKSETLKQYWTFALDKIMTYSIEPHVRKKFPNISIVPIEQISIPKKKNKNFRFVKWDEGIIVPAKNHPKPYSLEYSCCIAILLRSYLSEENQPSQLGLVHFMREFDVKNFLQKVEKKTPEGEIEIFIAGGKKNYIGMYTTVKGQIDAFLEETHCKVKIIDDKYCVADLYDLFIKTTNRYYTINSQLRYVGFSQNNNPLAIINPTLPSFLLNSKTEKIEGLETF
ncbi:MAG: hypothetical protein L0207_06920 [Chlamydiae bacterium]|nr:hypothetical protein [Chlamydiota bacterium]